MLERVARAIKAKVPYGYGMTEAETIEYARAAIEAIGPELRACIAYFDSYAQDEADDPDCCVIYEQHEAAGAFKGAVEAFRASLKEGEGEAR